MGAAQRVITGKALHHYDVIMGSRGNEGAIPQAPMTHAM